MSKVYRIKDVAEILNLKVRTVREWIKTGKMKARKLNGCPMWFIDEEEVNRILGR